MSAEPGIRVALAHEHGLACVREAGGGELVLSVAPGHGATRLDGWRPAVAGVWRGLYLHGGRLPDGAVAARLTSPVGERQAADVGGGAWIALSPGRDTAVCFLDAAGALVPPPFPAAWWREPVTDADVPCPACDSCDWAGAVADDGSRGTSATWGGPLVPTPFVRCRACGHEEAGVDVHAAEEERAAPVVDPAVEAAAAGHLAAERARTGRALERIAFPVYGVAGEVPRLYGLGTSGRGIAEVDIVHGEHLRVTSSTERRWDEPATIALEELRRALAATDEEWPVLSPPALRLWLRDREREQARVAAGAWTGEVELRVSGCAVRFALARAGEHWAACGEHDGVTLTLTGSALEPGGLVLEPLADPAALA